MIYNLYEVEKSEGKIRSLKILTMKEIAIGNFMYDVYITLYIYHIHYVHILFINICENLQHDTWYPKLGNICTIRYYAERMSTNFNLKIQTVHFGNSRSLSIEGCNNEIIKKELNGSY